MQSEPEVIFVSEASPEATKKKKKRRVKIRSYASKPDRLLKNLSWFVAGVVTGCFIVLASVLGVYKMAPTSFAAPMEQPQADNGQQPVLQQIAQTEAVKDASEFLSSRLNPVYMYVGSQKEVIWDTSDLRFGREWSWCEHSKQNSDTTLRQCFRVNPTDLDYRPETGSERLKGDRRWAMSLECRVSDCVTVQTYSNGPSAAPVLSYQERIIWYYNDQDEAFRSASAARRLLQVTGADRSPF